MLKHTFQQGTGDFLFNFRQHIAKRYVITGKNTSDLENSDLKLVHDLNCYE